MIDLVQGTVSFIIIESLVQSVLLWGVLALFLKWSGVSSPRVREVAFLLPLFVPVALTTASHVLIPAQLSIIPRPKLLEALIEDYVARYFPLTIAFVSIWVLCLAASVTLAVRQWLAWARARHAWQQQESDKSALRRRCYAALQLLAQRAQVAAPGLVLVPGEGARSLALHGRGFIFLSRSLAERLDDEELKSLFAHELAHIARKDGLVDALAGVCRNLMLFNPIAHFALRDMRAEREQAADDLAVRLGGERLALASCLVKAYRGSGPRPLVAGTGLTGSASLLERRVLRMVGDTGRSPSGGTWLAMALVTAATTVVLTLVL